MMWGVPKRVKEELERLGINYAEEVRKYLIRRVGESEKLISEALDYGLTNQVIVYDSYYVVLARRLGAVAYTVDERLLRRLRGKEPAIKHIKE